MDLVSHYSIIEVEEQISMLEEAGVTRLLNVYRTLGCEQRARLADVDVLHHVITQALELERRWPRDLNIITYLAKSGRSFIDNESKKSASKATTASIDDFLHGESLAADTSAMAKLSHSSTQECVENHQTSSLIAEWMEKIRQLFVDDKDANCFIEQKLEEMKKSKIMTFCEFSDQIYRNVEKRIKDKVRKRFPNGFPWWSV